MIGLIQQLAERFSQAILDLIGETLGVALVCRRNEERGFERLKPVLRAREIARDARSSRVLERCSAEASHVTRHRLANNLG
jgi:hypothetical protein